MNDTFHIEAWHPPGYEGINKASRGMLIEIDGMLMECMESRTGISEERKETLEEFRRTHALLPASSPELRRFAAILRKWQAHLIDLVIDDDERDHTAQLDVLDKVADVLGNHFWTVDASVGGECEEGYDGIALLRDVLNEVEKGCSVSSLGEMQARLAERLRGAGLINETAGVLKLELESQKEWRNVRGGYDLHVLLRMLNQVLIVEAREDRRVNGDDLTSATDLVSLSQMATYLKRSKKTLERLKDELPAPDIKGGRGKMSAWSWQKVKPFLEERFNRKLPGRFPGEYSY